MESKDLKALSDVYLQHVYEDKKYGYDKDGNSLNPADIEERKKKDDDLAGSPNKNGDDKKNGKKKAKRWWDDDGDGKGYEKGEVKEAVYGKSPAQVEGERRKKDNLAGSPLVVTNADKKANTKAYQNYKAGVKGYKAADHMKEEQLQEKQKDTPDQVKAVIAYDKARKGTDDATYDSEHGDKKQAKKERDYAKWQRDQGAEFAQKSGHPWEHAKGSTREKEGKKSVKHAHVQDSYDWQTESDLWDDIAEKLTELHELGGVKFKVVPFDLQEEDNWIKGAVKRPGAFTKKAKAAGMSVQQFASHVDKNKDKYSTRTERQANLAQTFSKMKKEGADYDALSSFLVQEGADDQAVNYILANWVEDVRLGKIEEGEKLAQKAYKRAQELGAKRRRSGDPSGIYKSERAGYNLAQSQRSDNESPATQRGPQTGGGPKDFGFARHKKNPVKSKSVGDTGSIGHAKKAQEKTSVGKSGKKLKTPKYKLSFQQRRDHHSDWSKRQQLKDPKKNPKHTANK